MSFYDEKREQKFKYDIKEVNSNFHKLVNSDDEEEIIDCYDVILGCLKELYEYRLRIARQNK